MGYAHSNLSLELAVDITNTYKHSKRDPGKRTCSITDATIRPGGAVVTFTWIDPQGVSHREDCLDLADRALNAWSAFLSMHGLEP